MIIQAKKEDDMSMHLLPFPEFAFKSNLFKQSIDTWFQTYQNIYRPGGSRSRPVPAEFGHKAYSSTDWNV